MTTEQFLQKHYANEDQLTADVNMYINNNYPQLRGFYFHIPNESATNKLMRLKLHAMGILAGVPDFIFLLPQLWFMELKMPNGKLSDKQKALHLKWQQAGIKVYTCYNKQQIVEILSSF